VEAGRLLGRAVRTVSHPLIASPHPNVIAAGKAAPAMVRAFAADRHIGEHLVVSTGQVDWPEPPAAGWIRAGHPVPDEASVRAGRNALDLASRTAPDGALVVLLSGGASSLMACPADGITLEDKLRTTDALLRGGADIASLNAVRKHLSRIKGGRLAAANRGATLTFALSDVVGNDLATIGSGPTAADPTTFADALEVLSRFHVEDRVPQAVMDLLSRGAAGAIADTPKPGCAALSRSAIWLIGSIRDAMQAAAAFAESRGYRAIVLRDPIVGEARAAGRDHARRVRDVVRGVAGRSCVVSGGETTVTVRGTGRGGRNQEFMLAACETLPSVGEAIVAAGVGTDGIDGPTDAAGAMIDTDSAARLRAAGIDIGAALDANDSYRAFDAIGGLIRTGPTGTNVGDLQVVLVEGVHG
jgi:glycerate 2-kinase